MAVYRRVTCPCWPSRRRPDDGFTIVEVLVAMGVIFTTLLLMAITMVNSLSAVGFSRQRTEATALANQALEQIRALPANHLFMSTTDLSDPQLVSCGSNTCFNTRTVPVADFGGSASTGPLTPHIAHANALPGNTTYTIQSYLTADPTDTATPPHTLVATVQVSWSNSQKGGVASHLQVESKVYNAQFNDAPPGIHTFLANARGGPGTITLSGTVLGSKVADVHFNLPSTTAGMDGTSLPGSTNVGASGGPVTAGIAQSGVNAGALPLLNTPAATAAAQSPGSPPGQTTTSNPTVAGALQGSGAIALANVTGTTSVGSSETASAEAASSATAGTVLTPGSPALPANTVGFGRGTASQTGAVGANLAVAALLGPPTLGIGLVNLVPTGNSTPNYSTVAQNGTAGAPQAQTYSATANQQFSELDILTLSALGLPLFPGPLLKLTGFQQTAFACAGPGTPCTVAPPVDTGTISVLGNTAVSVQQLLSGGVPISFLNSALVGVNLPLGGVTTLAVTGTGIQLNSTPASSGSVPSPISINLHVAASLLGISLLDLDINVTLGSVSASASYS